MRKLICGGLLGTLLVTALYWAAAPWTTRSSSATEQQLQLGKEEIAAAPSEPRPVDTLLPDPAEQPVETIDLLRSDDSLRLAGQEEPVSGLQNAPSEQLIPVESIRSADAEGCLRWMSHGAPTEAPRGMPRPAGDAESDARLGSPEEQEEPMERTVDSKLIEERLKHVLQSYLNKGKWGAAAVDTLEFRPSDAKEGEFDRIPF